MRSLLLVTDQHLAILLCFEGLAALLGSSMPNPYPMPQECLGWVTNMSEKFGSYLQDRLSWEPVVLESGCSKVISIDLHFCRRVSEDASRFMRPVPSQNWHWFIILRFQGTFNNDSKFFSALHVRHARTHGTHAPW